MSVICLVVLFCLSAAFSSSETILFSLTPAARKRLAARSARWARLAQELEDASLLLSTLLVGNTLVNFAIATVGYNLFATSFPRWGGLVAVPAMTIFLLLFGEITPKRLALRYAETLAPACVRFVTFWRLVLTPFNLAFGFSARAFSRALERERRALSDAELVSVLEVAAERGDFAAADAEMIAGVLRLSELHASDEMTPRVDIEGYDVDYPEEVRKSFLAVARHRLLPVYRRRPDAIEGVIDVETGRVEDALFVPEQITLDDLLVTFCRSGRTLAIVTDEYGGTAGLITKDDVMEIIMGPQVFDNPSEEPQIVRTGRFTWTIDGRASLDEVNRALGIELEADDADRVAGWVAYHAERIPHVGQKIEADGCRVTVLRRRRRRVTEVSLEVLSYPEVDSDAEILAETDEAVEKTEEDDL